MSGNLCQRRPTYIRPLSAISVSVLCYIIISVSHLSQYDKYYQCLVVYECLYHPDSPPPGVQDFVPECTTPKDPKTAESIDRQVSVASDWMKSYPGVRVTNIQTVYHKVDDGWGK